MPYLKLAVLICHHQLKKFFFLTNEKKEKEKRVKQEWLKQDPNTQKVKKRF